MAEAEIKFQITAEEFAQLPAVLQRLNFIPGCCSRFTDYYLEFTQSPWGGWDFTRLRVCEGAGDTLTRKHWIGDPHGNAVRLEEEHPLTQEDAETLLQNAGHPLSLCKQRCAYHGNAGGFQATIALDTLVLEDTPYFFLECEVMTLPESARHVRDVLRQWALASLPISTSAEAMSMLELLLMHRGAPGED